MNRVLFVFTFVLLSFVLVPSAFAKNVKIADISLHLEAIQVGAFKERKNILKQMQRFSRFHIFIDKADGLSRFYLVNIKKEAYAKILAEVQKSNPTAFLANWKIKKIVENHQLATMPKRDKRYHHDRYTLNSATILKTRKKFF